MSAISKELEQELITSVHKAIEKVIDENLQQKLDMYFGADTLFIAALSAVNVILAVHQFQRDAVEANWLAEEE